MLFRRSQDLALRTYCEILRYQEQRTLSNEERLRQALEPTIKQLMVFRPYMPAYKQQYFNLLETEWRRLAPGDLIMLFDHCVSIMHLRLERTVSASEALQPWSLELLELLDQRRQTPAVAPAGWSPTRAGPSATRPSSPVNWSCPA